MVSEQQQLTTTPPLFKLIGFKLGNLPGWGAPWQYAALAVPTAAAARARIVRAERAMLAADAFAHEKHTSSS